MKTKTRNLITAIAITGITLSIAGPAMAVTSGVIRPTADKGVCLTQIARSLDALTGATDDLDSSATVTAAHRADLDPIINSAQSGLLSAQARVTATADPAVLLDVCTTIGPNYRVDEVIIPQIEITIAADRISAAEVRVIDPTVSYLRAVAEAEAAGADMAEAVALHDLAMTEFMEAFDLIHGVADTVLTVTPASYDAGPGADVVATARESVATSTAHMRAGWHWYTAARTAFDEALASI